MQNNDLIFKLMFVYSPRQLDILLVPQEELLRKPTKHELKKFVEDASKNYDFDTISMLNEKYDLSVLDEPDDMRPVSEEEAAQAELEFVEYMEKINPDFEMPEFKTRGDSDEKP